MKIPFLDFSIEIRELFELGLMKEIEETLLSGKFLFGPHSEKLEQLFSEMFSSKAILVGSGTDALIISLKSLGISFGDKVAIPSFSAIPTAAAVKILGAEPIYIDVDDSITINTELLEKEIEEKNIKAVVPVHIFGNTCNMLEILDMCNKRNIPVVEDCAQSFGSKIGDKFTGTFGITGAFSFYPSKNLGAAGDSGMILTNDEKLYNKIKELRFYGQTSKYKMGIDCGINSRTDEIQSTILLKKMELFQKNIERKRMIKEKYDLHFKNITIDWKEDVVAHIYPLLSLKREETMNKLKQKGIETLIHYPFCLYEEMEKFPSDLNSKKISKEIFSIPFNSWISEEEVDYIIKSVEEVMNEDIINR